MTNPKQKGNRGERAVAKLFKDWWGSDFAKTPMSGGFSTAQFREDWNAAGDLVTPDELFPFCVEVKWREGWHLEQVIKDMKSPIMEWWDQCINESPDGRIPLLVFKRNRHPWYFMVEEKYVKDFMYCYYNAFTTDDHLGNRVVVGLLDLFFSVDKNNWLNNGKEE